MSNTVIKIENLSKHYRLGQVGTGSFVQDINRWWHKTRGLEDPYLKITETNDRTLKGTSDWVWALKDINLEFKQGEVVGIIGRNGAGKSTLLKILSRVTGPTTGTFKVKGRIASLLEVGTGFHPELTGRENIFLNGAILGMTKNEIRSKFDAIVEFSGIERYIDTPVKRYSSGMYVRLAFAVAAHLDSEILIIDEVLAVGDAEFQKKCLGKMKSVSGEGRTVLFVSHNIVAVQNLCDRCIYLSNGKLNTDGPTTQVINQYITQSLTTDNVRDINNGIVPDTWERPWGHDGVDIISVNAIDENSNNTNSIYYLDFFKVRVVFDVKRKLSNVKLQLRIANTEEIQITRSDSKNDGVWFDELEIGRYQVDVNINIQLMPGEYTYFIYVSSLDNSKFYDAIPNFGRLKIEFLAREKINSELSQKVNTFINLPAKWEITNL